MKEKKQVSFSKLYGCRRMLYGCRRILLIACVALFSICLAPLILTSPELNWHIDNNIKQYAHIYTIPVNKESDIIAFICEDSRYRSSIYTVHPDGSHLRRIRDHPFESHTDITWAPDGIWMAMVVKNHAYIIWEDPKYEIYRIRFDGLDSKRLTYNHYREFSPRWSQEGASILYTSIRGLHQISASGHEISQSGAAYPSSFIWTSDGEFFVDRYGSPIPHTANLGGLDLELPGLEEGARIEWGWGSNGEQTFYHTRFRFPDRLYVINVKTKVQDFAVNMYTIYDAQWSPNGKWISIVGRRDDNDGESLYLFDVNTGFIRDFNESISKSIGSTPSMLVSWSPDSKWITFSRGYPDDALFKIKSDGTALQKLVDLNCAISEVSWSPK